MTYERSATALAAPSVGAARAPSGAVTTRPPRRRIAERRRTRLAQAAVVGAAVLWGATGNATDAVIGAGFGPLELAFWRLAIGAAMFCVHARREGSLRLHQPRDLVPLALLGVLVMAANHAAFGLATASGGVSLVNLFIAFAPGVIAAGAYVWFRENLSARTLGLVVLGVAGLVLAAVGGGSGVAVTPRSIAFGVVTMLTVVGYTLGTTALLDRYTPAAVSAFVMLIGAVALAPFVRFEARPLGAWLGVLALGAGATYLANLLYVIGLTRLGATTTGLIVSLEAPAALGLAAVLLGERFTAAGLVGVTLVLVSSAVVIVDPVGRRREPPPP